MGRPRETGRGGEGVRALPRVPVPEGGQANGTKREPKEGEEAAVEWGKPARCGGLGRRRGAGGGGGRTGAHRPQRDPEV